MHPSEILYYTVFGLSFLVVVVSSEIIVNSDDEE